MTYFIFVVYITYIIPNPPNPDLIPTQLPPNAHPTPPMVNQFTNVIDKYPLGTNK